MILDNFPNALTILHPGTAPDAYGNVVASWASASSTTVRGRVGQLSTIEAQAQDRDASASLWRLYAPAGTALAPQDRVVFEGETYEVDGEPYVAHSPRGAHHVQARLRRVEG